MYDVLIIGGGVSGVSCALVLGSAKSKPFAENKKIGLLSHQKASSLHNAVFNNAYGIAPRKLGSELLTETLEHLNNSYPHIEQIAGEKVIQITGEKDNYTVITNKNSYKTKSVALGIGSSNPFLIAGLEHFVEPHKKAAVEKNRIQLKNTDHLVKDGIYVMGTLAGHRSQLSIAAGSGASVATDILSIWNDNKPTQIHDALPK